MKSHPLSVTSCIPASDCPSQTSIAVCVSCWNTVEVSPLVCGAVGCILRSPPRPRGPRRPTQRRNQPVAPAAPSRTGSLLAGAGPGPTAPITMVSGRGGRRGKGSRRGRCGRRGRRRGACALAGPGSNSRLSFQVWTRGVRTLGILSPDGCWGPAFFLGRPCRAWNVPRHPPWMPSQGDPAGPPGLPPPARSSQVSRG